MSKTLKKNEIRLDRNPKHKNLHGSGHKAIISLRKGHKYLANTITHSEEIEGTKTLNLNERRKQKGPYARVSPPFWQSENMFGKEVLGKFSKQDMSRLRRYNRKFKKKGKI